MSYPLAKESNLVTLPFSFQFLSSHWLTEVAGIPPERICTHVEIAWLRSIFSRQQNGCGKAYFPVSFFHHGRSSCSYYAKFNARPSPYGVDYYSVISLIQSSNECQGHASVQPAPPLIEHQSISISYSSRKAQSILLGSMSLTHSLPAWANVLVW
jgi:hypothetical protein